MFELWLVLRYLKSGQRFLSLSAVLSVVGVILGIASLVVSMAVVAGVERLLKDAIIDLTGHLVLMRPATAIRSLEELETRIRKILPEALEMTPFVHLEAVMAKGGKISGVAIEGIDPQTSEKVMNLRHRLKEGAFDFSVQNENPGALIGKGLAQKFKLNVGDEFTVVLPNPDREKMNSFNPRPQRMRVAGILELGKYEFNERVIVTEMGVTQRLANIGKNFSGVKMRLKSEEGARQLGLKLATELGYPWWTRDWMEVSQNFFAALRIERIVLFVVLLFMVVVASFNVSSTLFVNVVRRFSDISVLKTLGAGTKFLVRLFVYQGLLLGFLGAVGGLLLGILVSFVASAVSIKFIPAEIYKFDHLPIVFRFVDLAAIFVCSFLICWLSSLIPAKKGAALNPVEGLRYE